MIDTQIIVALSGSLTALAGTWLGARLNQRGGLQTALQLADVERQKYAQDRLWDARKEAYTAIVISLNSLYKTADNIHDGFFGECAEPERFFNDESFSKLSSEFWERYRSLSAEFGDATLILSDSFKTLFGEWRADFASSDENDLPPEHFEQYYKSIGRYLPRIIEAAKMEIAPANGASSSRSLINAKKTKLRLPWRRLGQARADAEERAPPADLLS